MHTIKQLFSAPWATPLLIAACIFLLPFGRSTEAPMGIMAIAGLVRFLRNPDEVSKDPMIQLFAGLFACIWVPMLLSLPDAVNSGRALSTVLTFLRFLFMGIFMIDAFHKPGVANRVFVVLGIVLSLWTFDALLQSVVGWNLLGYPYDNDRLRGIFYPDHKLGNVLAVFIPVFLEALRQVSKRWRWAWFTVIPYASVILLSGSRTAWMMMGFGFIFYGFGWILSLAPAKRLQKLSIATLLAVAAVFALSMNPRFSEKVQTTAGLFKGDYQLANQATSNRLPIWRVSLKVFEDHWLNGIGPRGFRYIYPAYAEADDIWIRQNPNQGPTHPHQITLEIGVETGIIGLVGFGILWIWIIRRWWSARADAYNPQLPWIAALGVGMLPLNAGHALYASFWSGIVFWLLAVAVAMQRASRTSSSHTPN